MSEDDDVTSSCKKTQIAASCAAALGGFAMGMVIGWSALVQQEVTSGAAFGFAVTPEQFSWVGSVALLGAAFSCVPSGVMVGVVGRKNTMLCTSVPLALGWGLVTWPVGVEMLITGRFVTGFCGGVLCIVSPMYIAEIAEIKIRGSLTSLFHLLLCAGLELSYILGAFVSVYSLSIISGIVPIIFGIIIFFIPETPIYLIIYNYQEDAEKSLQWFRGSKFNIKLELNEINQYLSESSKDKISFLQMFRNRIAVKGILIMAGVMCLHQLSGTIAVIFYANDIFKTAGSTLDPKISTIVIGAVMLVATIPATFTVDRMGRKVLLVASAIAMAISLVLLGFYFYFNDQFAEHSWLPLATLILYFCFFAMGAGPLPWILIVETFSPEIKGHAVAISVLLNWILAFSVTKLYINMVHTFGSYSTFWIFSAFCILGALHVIFFVPETKGKNIEQILKQL